MNGEPENPIVTYLRRLDQKLDRILDTLQYHGRRISALEAAISDVSANEINQHANTALRIDRMEERLGRIERRLELTEA